MGDLRQILLPRRGLSVALMREWLFQKNVQGWEWDVILQAWLVLQMLFPYVDEVSRQLFSFPRSTPPPTLVLLLSFLIFSPMTFLIPPFHKCHFSTSSCFLWHILRFLELRKYFFSLQKPPSYFGIWSPSLPNDIWFISIYNMDIRNEQSTWNIWESTYFGEKKRQMMSRESRTN